MSEEPLQGVGPTQSEFPNVPTARAAQNVPTARSAQTVPEPAQRAVRPGSTSLAPKRSHALVTSCASRTFSCRPTQGHARCKDFPGIGPAPVD
ncbi:hypothetical protein T484DRAFT_2227335 [Baffinella frigidus]|nr:hypothetical protein T484DRAFT_2227335 [Cryptophyta sp. CCMP2293]